MTVRIRPLLLIAIVLSSVLGACSSGPSCTAHGNQVSKVRTGPLRTALPGVRPQAVEHWASQPQGDPCSRAPGPTDWRYQDVVMLDETDVTALTRDWLWRKVPAPDDDPGTDGTVAAHPADVWPQLAGYLPVDPIWLHSDGYDGALPPYQWHVAFLDTTDKVLLIFTFDH